MSSLPASKRLLSLAWAVRVSLRHLEPGLVAYVDTKASITTFRLAARYTLSKAFRQLPEEVLSLIADQVRNAKYQQEWDEWSSIVDCLTNKCESWFDHLCPADMKDRGSVGSSKLSTEGVPINEYDHSAWNKHWDVQHGWLDFLTNPYTKSKEAKRIHAFTRECGIQPYFQLRRIYDKDRFCKIDAKAYLMLPLEKYSVHLASDGMDDPSAGFAVDSAIDLSKLNSLTDEQLQDFEKVARILRVRPINTDPRKKESKNKSKTGLLGSKSYGNDIKEDEADSGKKSIRPQLMLLGCGERSENQ